MVVQLVAVGPVGLGKNQECSATGLVIDPQGDILTNAHVVSEARRCLEGNPSARILAKVSNSASPTAAAVSCTVVAVDNLHDLALLRTIRPLSQPDADLPPAVGLYGGAVNAGTKVMVIGFPASSWQPVAQSGNVTGYQNERLSKTSGIITPMMALKVALQPGSSGSPVYLEDGAIVGIVEGRLASDTSLTLAVPVNFVAEFLSRQGVKWQAVTPPSPVGP